MSTTVQELDGRHEARVYLPLLTQYVNGAGNRVTRNLGSIGGEVLLGANGGDAANFPDITIPGRVKGARFLHRGGQDDMLTIPDSDGLSFSDGVTDRPFSFVLTLAPQVTTVPTAIWYLLGKGVAGGGAEYALYAGFGLLIFFVCNPAWTAYRGRSAPQGGTWVNGIISHLVCTYDGSATCAGFAIYCNGLRVDTADVTAGAYTAMTPGAATLWCGGISGSGTDDLDMYDLSIYPRVLTPTQVAYLYERAMRQLNVGM